jgi:hypothetical protein
MPVLKTTSPAIDSSAPKEKPVKHSPSLNVNVPVSPQPADPKMPFEPDDPSSFEPIGEVVRKRDSATPLLFACFALLDCAGVAAFLLLVGI